VDWLSSYGTQSVDANNNIGALQFKYSDIAEMQCFVIHAVKLFKTSFILNH